MTTPQSRLRAGGLRAVDGRFPKGVSGNPGGRPKGLRARVRELTNDGDDLAAYMHQVFNDPKETTRTRMEAATWLADRGFGKPIQGSVVYAEERAAEADPIKGLSLEEIGGLLEQLRELRAARGGSPVGSTKMGSRHPRAGAPGRIRAFG